MRSIDNRRLKVINEIDNMNMYSIGKIKPLVNLSKFSAGNNVTEFEPKD